MTTNVLLRIFNIINFFFSRCRLYPFFIKLVLSVLSNQLREGSFLSCRSSSCVISKVELTYLTHLNPAFSIQELMPKKGGRPQTLHRPFVKNIKLNAFLSQLTPQQINIFFCCCLFLSFGLILPNHTRIRNILQLQIYYWTLNRLPVATFNRVVIVSSINSYRFNLRTSTS